MENELSNSEKDVKLPAEEIHLEHEVDFSKSEKHGTLEINATFSIYSPLNRFVGKQSVLTKVEPGWSAEISLKIQKHQKWALAKLKTLGGSDRFTA